MGSKLVALNRWETIGLISIFFLAVLLRVLPPVKYGLPYGLDVYEFASRVFVLNEGRSVSLPHGPLYYYLQLTILRTVDYERFLWVLTYLEPILFTFFILPPYFLSRQLRVQGNMPLFTLLYVAVTNVIVHQVGGALIPEGLGIFFYGLTILFYFKSLNDDWRWMLPAILTGVLTTMSHHLSAFQLIVFSTSLLLPYIYYYICYRRSRVSRLIILVFLNIMVLSVSSLIVWIIFGGEENMLKLMFDMIGERFILLVLLFPGAVVFPFLTFKIAEFVKKDGKFTFKRTLLMILMGISILGLLVSILYPNALPLILWFCIPLSLGFFPFVAHGISQYSKRTDILNVVFFLAPLMIFSVELFFLLLLKDYSVLLYRIPTFAIYFIAPLAGYGLSHLGEDFKNTGERYLAGMIVSYFLFSLALTSYPTLEFSYGVKEAISRSEITLAKDAYEYSLIFNVGIDTDNRLGNLLLFVSHMKVRWVGNITSWFLPSNSWLVNVSISGEPYYPRDDTLILFSNYMRGLFGGKFVNLATKPSYPINEKIVDFLNNSPGIDRLEDVGDGSIYMCAPPGKS
ncbi:MAG: hypothetical protein ACUVQY_07615 [Thermoproteota archaeon]